MSQPTESANKSAFTQLILIFQSHRLFLPPQSLTIPSMYHQLFLMKYIFSILPLHWFYQLFKCVFFWWLAQRSFQDKIHFWNNPLMHLSTPLDIKSVLSVSAIPIAENPVRVSGKALFLNFGWLKQHWKFGTRDISGSLFKNFLKKSTTNRRFVLSDLPRSNLYIQMMLGSIDCERYSLLEIKCTAVVQSQKWKSHVKIPKLYFSLP